MDVSGIPFGRRGKIADEYIQVLRSIWRGRPFQGRFVSVPPHLFKPLPSRGTIPIWIGGNSEAALRRAGRLGNGWIPMGSHTPEELGDLVGIISETSRLTGREDPVSICCNHAFTREKLSDPRNCLDIVESYGDAGATHMIPRFEVDSTSEMAEMMEAFAEAVITRL